MNMITFYLSFTYSYRRALHNSKLKNGLHIDFAAIFINMKPWSFHFLKNEVL